LIRQDKDAALAVVAGSGLQRLTGSPIHKRQGGSAFPPFVGPLVSGIGGLHVEPRPLALPKPLFQSIAFTRRRKASRRSIRSPSQMALSERRSSDLRRSMSLRRSNPRRRSRPDRRSAPSQAGWFWRRSRPERDPPLSWISRSVDFQLSASRSSLVAVIRFSHSLNTGLGVFSSG